MHQPCVCENSVMEPPLMGLMSDEFCGIWKFIVATAGSADWKLALHCPEDRTAAGQPQVGGCTYSPPGTSALRNWFCGVPCTKTPLKAVSMNCVPRRCRGIVWLVPGVRNARPVR